MKALSTILLLFFFFAYGSARADSEFIYPDSFDGEFVRGNYDFSTYGFATHNGYISLFNIDRKTIESLLPPGFSLAINQNQKTSPLIVVWGEMSDTGAHYGSDIWYGLKYREIQFYIPGVIRKDGFKEDLRTYVPRMFVDAYEPEFLGRRFFYKKIELKNIPFDITQGIGAEDWVDLTVKSENIGVDVTDFADRRWKAILTYLPNSDIMGDQNDEFGPRCSGFNWVFNESSRIAPAKVSLQINKLLTHEMNPEIIGKQIESVASFRLENWSFLLDYNYTKCIEVIEDRGQ